MSDNIKNENLSFLDSFSFIFCNIQYKYKWFKLGNNLDHLTDM